MNLIPNWKSVLTKSASLWCMRFAILITLAVPALLYKLAAWDTDPVMWGWIAVALWVLGEFLRIWDQGMKR